MKKQVSECTHIISSLTKIFGKHFVFHKIADEFVKSHAFRALRAYVPWCFKLLRAYVDT